eukprot:261758-Rhodomonas_salina.1
MLGVHGLKGWRFMDCYVGGSWTERLAVHGLLGLCFMDCYVGGSWTAMLVVHGLLCRLCCLED